MTNKNLDNNKEEKSNGVKMTRNSRTKPEYIHSVPSTKFVAVDLTNEIMGMLHEDSWCNKRIRDNDSDVHKDINSSIERVKKIHDKIDEKFKLENEKVNKK
jgi:hypothetical protein